MKKITVRAVSLIIALLMAITSVSAAAFEAPISTYRYSSVSSMSVFLSISSSGYATCTAETSVYKGYKQDKIEMRGDRAEMSDFPLYLNTVAGGLDRRDQTIGGFSFVVKIYAVPVVEIIG